MSNVHKESITIWSQGVRLAGDIYKPENLKESVELPGIVMVPGWGGNKKTWRKTMRRTLRHRVLLCWHSTSRVGVKVKGRLSPWSHYPGPKKPPELQ